jgi:hypothetical protein
MIAVSQFFPLVGRECPGVPSFSMSSAVIEACRDFCARSLVWQADHDPLTAVEGIADYDLEPPESAIVTEILGMYHNNLPLSPRTIEQLNNENYNWRTLSGKQARHWVQKDTTSITLTPFPSVTAVDSIKNIRVALKPTADATEVGDILYNEYREAIAHGALAILMAMTKKPWTNKARAKEHAIDFDEAVSQARIRARKGYGRADLHLRQAMRRFGGP